MHISIHVLAHFKIGYTPCLPVASEILSPFFVCVFFFLISLEANLSIKFFQRTNILLECSGALSVLVLIYVRQNVQSENSTVTFTLNKSSVYEQLLFQSS